MCKEHTHEIVEVKGCRINCPFYFSSMVGMECEHPYFKGKVYENMIPTHKKDIPDDCPLKKEPFIREIRLTGN